MYGIFNSKKYKKNINQVVINIFYKDKEKCLNEIQCVNSFAKTGAARMQQFKIFLFFL